jgi:1-acyl-sn-glycerol-3-phosphate acyltransferase
MKLTYRFAWLVLRAGFRCYFRWRAYHAERVPLQGPAIIAANHASYLDPPLVGCGARRELHYLARESLFRHRVFGAILREVNSVPVDREGGGAAGLKAILERLLAGEAILLFPEGTRTHDGCFLPAQAGVGLAVIKSACPVIPARVFGSWEAYGRRYRFPRPRRILIKFGPPLLFEQLRAEAKTCPKPRLKQIYQQVADEIMAAILKLEPCKDVAALP